MCGRYVNHEDVDALSAALGIPATDPVLLRFAAAPRYNIAPTQEIFAVRSGAGGAQEGAAFHWGLVPFWAKDKAIGNRMINARSETAFEKPSFRSAIRKRRCLVPASGFYEWKKTPGGKQPHFIHRADGFPLLFAGIWETWDKDSPALESAAILTTSANSFISEIHDRMPVILDPADRDAWLDTDTAESGLAELMRPGPEGLLAAHPVSTLVNKPVNDSPDLIERVDPGLDLFGEGG